MWWALVARLVIVGAARISALAGSRIGQAALVGGAAYETGVTLAQLRDQAQVEAGASDPAALDGAAHAAARMLGLDGSNVLWPTDRLGNKIAPKYFHLDLQKGRAWYTAEYFSKKSVRRFGGGRGRFSGGGYRRMASVASAIADRRG